MDEYIPMSATYGCNAVSMTAHYREITPGSPVSTTQNSLLQLKYIFNDTIWSDYSPQKNSHHKKLHF